MGVNDKSGVCAALVQRKKLGKAEICCIGDDLPDLPVFEQAASRLQCGCSLRDQSRSRFLNEKQGGKGAVREICEAILKSKGLCPILSAKTEN